MPGNSSAKGTRALDRTVNFNGLLPHQPEHARAVCRALARYGAALDASDTGTGKTYVALAVCREFGVVPFIVGPKNAYHTAWRPAAEKLGVEIEYANYEKVRGRRALRGGVEVDTIRLTENRGVLFDTPVVVAGLRSGRIIFTKKCSSSDATDFVNLGLKANDKPPEFIAEFGEYEFTIPFLVNQENVAESEWILEKKYGSGSFLRWKNAYSMMIFDEVHRCGGTKSLNSKLLIAARKQSKFVLTLSATAADDPRQMKALGFALGLHQNNGKFGFRPWLIRHGCNLDKETNQISLSLNTSRQTSAFEAMHKEIFPSRGARMRKSEIPGFPHSKIEVKLLDPDSAVKKLTKELHDLHQEYAENARTTGLWVSRMQELELLMVPHALEIAEDLAGEMRVAIFVSYQKTRVILTAQLEKMFGKNLVGFVDGSQVGDKGFAQRMNFVDRFQRNELAAMVLNSNAGGENISLHDPTGKVERGTLIFPQDSGRRLKQIFGRVDRATGANSLQYLLYFSGTEQEQTAKRVTNRLNNIELLNDSELFF